VKVLLITHIFWPETADFKNLALANELVSRGHEVTVLTAFPNYPLGRLYDGYRLSWRQWDAVGKVRVLRVPLYPDHSPSGLKRLLNYGSFTLSASTIGAALVRKMDVTYVYSPPMTLGLTAGLFKLLHGAPVLLDVVDLWPDAIRGSGMASSRLLVEGSGWIARGAYRLADRITVLTEGFAARLESAGVPKGKMTVMPPWADRGMYHAAEPDKAFGDAYGLRGKLCVIHAGNIGPFQDAGNVLSAAEQLRDLAALRIVFVGGGRDLEMMREQKRIRRLDNVVFAGNHPVEAMAGILAWGDALLVSLRSDPYLAINLPSKVPCYMASGRPVIACADGETGRLVAGGRFGLCCMPGDPTRLAETIRKLMALSGEERAEMGRNGRDLFERRFDKDLLIGKYVSMLESLASGRNGAAPGTRGVA
jgi:colanic acid biosynthesis glycosyl transferase WcaI